VSIISYIGYKYKADRVSGLSLKKRFILIENAFLQLNQVWACNFDAKSLFIKLCVVNGTWWHPQTCLAVFSAVSES
jgi:hypothetical protein